MADDLSLLFRLRAENTQAKSVLAETQAAVASLRTTFGSDMNQMQAASSKALGQIQNQLNNVVSRIPGGNAFISITEGLKGVAAQSERVSPALRIFNKTVDDLSKTTGKSSTELVRFLGEFVKLPNASERAILGYTKFGSKFDELRPKLEQAGTQLAKVAEEATASGTSLAAAAGPIGLIVVAAAAATVAVGLLGKALFDLARSSAEVEGKMFDLSQQTGVAVETLSALEVLAKTTGGDIGNLTQSLVAFQRNLESAQDPTSKQADLFRQLGVEANNTEDALRQTFAALARLPEGFSQTNQAAELFGARGGKQVLAILKESKGDLDGAIARFRELGILISETDAKAADEFNDQLALLQFQLRATAVIIGREVIPPALAALRELSDVIKENRDLINALAKVAGFLAQLFRSQLSVEIRKITAAWELAKPTILAIQTAYEAIATAAAFIAGHPILPSTVAPTAKPAKLEVGGEAAISDSRQRLKIELQAQREFLAAETAFFDQEKSLAAQRIATAEREFSLGQKTRKDKLQSVIEGGRAIRDAELAQIALKRALLATEATLASDDSTKRAELESQITTLDQKAADRRAQFDIEVKDARAAAQKQERDDEIAHREGLLELATKFDAARIASIEAAVAAGTRASLDADAEIAGIENAALDREQAFLVRKLAAAGVEPAERRKIALEIAKIDADRTALAQQQEDRRAEIVRQGVEDQRQLLTASIDTLLQVERIRGNAIIATIQALAAARVKTEEDAAQEITAIRLQLLDSEIEATRAKLQAAQGIADPGERAKAQADLNNQLKILEAQRLADQTQGERDREEGRRRDLENEDRYADELLRIRERIQGAERDIAQIAIEALTLGGASRRRVVRAQLDLDRQDEAERHSQALADLAAQRADIIASNRTQEEKRQALEELHRLIEAENNRHENENRLHVLRMIASRAFTRAQILEQIQLDSEIETKRHQKALEDLAKEKKDLENSTAVQEEKLRRLIDINLRTEEENKRHADAKKKQKDDEKTTERETSFAADANEGFLSGLESGQLTELEDGVESFRDVAIVAFSAVGAAVNGLAQGIGSLVQNWVLLGETGPAAMRKLVASVLAGVAAEAAVLAIFELAKGFAALFFNPAEAAAHFTSAALFGSIAGVAAVAGRGVAGDLFKPKTSTSQDSARDAGGQLNPLTLQRNAGPSAPPQFAPQIQPIQVVISVNDSKFGNAITAHVVDNVNNGGVIREIIANDGNLTRG